MLQFTTPPIPATKQKSYKKITLQAQPLELSIHPSISLSDSPQGRVKIQYEGEYPGASSYRRYRAIRNRGLSYVGCLPEWQYRRGVAISHHLIQVWRYFGQKAQQ